ncbi:MAG: CRISPR-associated protein Cas4 [Candidatus Altiarchaeota archaeon]
MGVISVSDLGRFLYCPRQVYLESFLGLGSPQTLEMGRGVVGHAVRRELSMRQRRLMERISSANDVDDLLVRELDAVLEDIPYIFAEKWSAGYGMFLPEVRLEMLSELEGLKADLSAMAEELGFEATLEYLTPWKTEYTVCSNSLRLKGRVDKVMRMPGIVPIDIKTGKVSELFREGDRIQLCAYGMLLEETFNTKIPHGFLEYTRIQERRPVVFSQKLRRQVVLIRDQVAETLSGMEPPVCPHGQPKKCDACRLNRICYRT